MNTRQKQLLEILSSGQTYTIKQLSILLSASYRTIQNDISALKAQDFPLVSQPNKGVFLQEAIEPAISEEDQILSLIRRFVESEDWIKVEELADEYFVSASTMKGWIKQVREQVETFGLTIQSKPGYGMKLTGSEAQIRRLIKRVKGLYHPDEIARKQIAGALDEVLIGSNLYITDENLVKLIRDIDIAAQRQKKGHFLEMETSELSYLYSFSEFELAQHVANRLSTALGLPRTLSETASVFKMLESRRKMTEEAIENMEDSIRQDLDALILSILEEIRLIHHVDLRSDLDLYMALGLHLIPLISRMKFNFQISNPLLDKVKRTYPQAFDLAITAGQALERQFGIRLAEDEIGYLATHFNLALERRKSVGKKKHVLVVCSSGGGLSKLLAYKIQRAFSQQIASIDTADRHEVKTLDLDAFDYVITTVPLETTLTKPTLQISHMLTREDLGRLKHDLMQGDRPGLAEMTSPRTFFSDIQATSRPEILREITRRLEDVYPLQKDFYQQLLERENLYSTEIGNGIVFPHPLRSTTPVSFLSITVLKKPVKWIHEQVQVVIVANIAKGDSERLQGALEQFAEFVSDQQKVLSLIENPEYGNCQNLLENI